MAGGKGAVRHGIIPSYHSLDSGEERINRSGTVILAHSLHIYMLKPERELVVRTDYDRNWPNSQYSIIPFYLTLPAYADTLRCNNNNNNNMK
jgi:hypothetical protein